MPPCEPADGPRRRPGLHAEVRRDPRGHVPLQVGAAVAERTVDAHRVARQRAELVGDDDDRRETAVRPGDRVHRRRDVPAVLDVVGPAPRDCPDIRTAPAGAAGPRRAPPRQVDQGASGAEVRHGARDLRPAAAAAGGHADRSRPGPREVAGHRSGAPVGASAAGTPACETGAGVARTAAPEDPDAVAAGADAVAVARDHQVAEQPSPTATRATSTTVATTAGRERFVCCMEPERRDVLRGPATGRSADTERPRR